MDEKELDELVKQHIKKIDDDEFMQKMCSIDEEECDDGDCSTCERARDALRAEILEAEEEKAKKNDPALILEFRPNPLEKNGASCNVNLANTIAEATDLESLIKATGLSSTGWEPIDDGPELDKSYPIWAKIREYVNKETPVQELLLQDKELPLLVQCECRVIAVAPYIK